MRFFGHGVYPEPCATLPRFAPYLREILRCAQNDRGEGPRMTGSEGLRMTGGEGLPQNDTKRRVQNDRWRRARKDSIGLYCFGWCANIRGSLVLKGC